MIIFNVDTYECKQVESEFYKNTKIVDNQGKEYTSYYNGFLPKLFIELQDKFTGVPLSSRAIKFLLYIELIKVLTNSEFGRLRHSENSNGEAVFTLYDTGISLLINATLKTEALKVREFRLQHNIVSDYRDMVIITEKAAKFIKKLPSLLRKAEKNFKINKKLIK